MASAVRTIPVSSPSAQRKYFRRSLLMWLIFIPLVFVIIIPLLFMATMAFTFEVDQFRMPIKWIPDPPTLLNFQKIFADPLIPLGRWFLNSLVVASVGTLIILFVSSLSGFAFARLQFPGKNALFSLLLFSLMIPAAITLIPSFLILRDLKLLDTVSASDSVRLLLLTEQSALEKALEFVVQGNTAQMNDQAFVDELKGWIRFRR